MKDLQRNWQEHYSNASKEFSARLESADFRSLRNPAKLLEWAEEAKSSAQQHSTIFGSGEVALAIGDRMAKLKSSDKRFDGVIVYAKSKGVESKVNTSSKRYAASVCISILLEGKRED